jgi:hypothetical protein
MMRLIGPSLPPATPWLAPIALLSLAATGCGLRAMPCDEVPDSERPYTCKARPELCDATVSRIGGGGGPLRISFVAENFLEREEDNFTDRVDDWFQTLNEGPGTLISRAPELYEVYTVFPHDQGAGSAYDRDVDDTPLGGTICKKPDSSSRWFSIDDDALDFLSEQLDLPPEHTWVVVFGEGRGRAASQNPMPGDGAAAIMVRKRDDVTVVDHELGHAIVGLADEYSEDRDRLVDDGPDDAVTSAVVMEHWALWHTPNLTSDPQGRKWEDVVSRAPEPGGWTFETGIFHPTDSCRMLNHRWADRFCPVCAREIDRFHASITGNDGPPECDLTAIPGGDGLFALEVHAFDFDGVDIWVTGDVEDGEYAPTRGGIRWQGFVTLVGDPTQPRRARLQCTDLEGEEVVVGVSFQPTDTGTEVQFFP